MARPCEHLKAVTEAKRPRARVCDACVKTGSAWVHLRTCQECGGTHCCDNSLGRHATRHAQVTGHPVVASAEPGERWMWCYPDAMYGATPGAEPLVADA